MSQKERERLEWIRGVAEGRLSQVEAAHLLRLSARQVRRVLRRYEAEGDEGLVHRLRGRPSNRKIEPQVRERALSALREVYFDFGPTLAAEKLEEREGIKVSRETVRQWLVSEGLRRPRRRKVRSHTWRPRRPCWGELVQMDTSVHDWFEARGEQAVLITMIDDATSWVLMRFFEADTTKNNMTMLKMYLRRSGRPLALYADKASHFKTTRPPSLEEELEGREALTQIGRALEELGIEYVPANSPQAKGRVERSFATCQDRLVKELRLRNIAAIAQANVLLERYFIPLWNRRFARPPASAINAHRSARGFDLPAILSVQTRRTVANDYTIRHKGQLYQIQPTQIQPGLRRAKVIVEERLDGQLKIRWQGRYLKYQKIQAPTPRREADAPGAETPLGLRPPSVSAPKPSSKPGPNHPWRRPLKPDISSLHKTGHS